MRIAMVPFTILMEPVTECLLLGTLGALAARCLLQVDLIVFYLVHVLSWFLLDWLMLSVVQVGPREGAGEGTASGRAPHCATVTCRRWWRVSTDPRADGANPRPADPWPVTHGPPVADTPVLILHAFGWTSRGWGRDGVDRVSGGRQTDLDSGHRTLLAVGW